MLRKLKILEPQHLSISVWWVGKGYTLLASPPFLFRHTLIPTLVGLVWSWFLVNVLREKATLMSAAGVPLWLSGSIPCQVRWWLVIKELDTEGHIPISYPWLSSISRHGGHPVCYPMASMDWDVYPSAKCTWSCRHPLPLHITWSLHLSSVDAPADVHGRSHSFLLIHFREVFLAWHWVIARPLSSHGIVSLSLPPKE